MKKKTVSFTELREKENNTAGRKAYTQTKNHINVLLKCSRKVWERLECCDKTKK